MHLIKLSDVRLQLLTLVRWATSEVGKRFFNGFDCILIVQVLAGESIVQGYLSPVRCWGKAINH